MPSTADASTTEARSYTGGADEFAANRGAARYAPANAEFEVGDRRFPVLTVSMSGISVRWADAALPAVGTVIDGDILTAPATTAPRFASLVQVVRIERANRIVAGRFVKQSGSAIDRLLSWLVRLDRGDAG